MPESQALDDVGWKTKPTDRFVLKWIKVNLSARITPRLTTVPWLAPWHITLTSAILGCVAGVVFASGFGWLAGVVAAVSQILDGVDGQYARLTRRVSTSGAFWDSVLDRYADGAMVIGMAVYLMRLPVPLAHWFLLLTSALAFVGSNLISYSSARAETLNIDIGKPTLASKGTRSSVMILCALLSLLWPAMPLLALFYLAVHTNAAVVWRLLKTRT